jgi:hypothetical protein
MTKDGPRLPGPPVGRGSNEAAASTASHGGGGDKAPEGVAAYADSCLLLDSFVTYNRRQDRSRREAAAVGRRVGQATQIRAKMINS